MAVIAQVAAAVKQEAQNRNGGNLMEFARQVGVNYDALYALVSGRRVRTVDADVLARLARNIPAVSAIFASSVSQARNV